MLNKLKNKCLSLILNINLNVPTVKVIALLLILISVGYIFLYNTSLFSNSIFSNNRFETENMNLMLPVSHKYSVISINANAGSVYFFHLVIVAVSWRAVGFEPIFLIVYSDSTKFDKFDNLTIKYLNHLNANIIYIKSLPSYEITTAMIIREMVGILPDKIVKDNDFIITTDSDLY